MSSVRSTAMLCETNEMSLVNDHSLAHYRSCVVAVTCQEKKHSKEENKKYISEIATKKSYYQVTTMSVSLQFQSIIKLINRRFDRIDGRLDQMDGRFDQMGNGIQTIVDELIPSNPNICFQNKNPLIVSPELPFEQPVPSTFTVVDIKKSVFDGSTDRRIIGSKHCCLKIMLDPGWKIDGKHVVYAELNDRILNYKVTRIGLINPSRGNINIVELQPVPDDPANDIVIVKVEEEFQEAKYVPVMPGVTAFDWNGVENGKVYHDTVCFGKSMHANVSSHYGLSFKIEKGIGTGLVKYLVSRAERGNSGTVMHVYKKSAGMELIGAPVGILRGLDTDHCAYNQQKHKFKKNYNARGVAVICPTLAHFQDFKVLNEGQCVHFLGQGIQVEAIVGYSQNNRRIETKSFTLRVQPRTNIVEMTRQDGYKTKGVLFLSDAMIPYASQVSCDLDPSGHTYAFG